MVGINEQDVIHINVPLLLRLLEWSKEEAAADIDLHYVVERLVELSERGDVLKMDNYLQAVPHTKNLQEAQ